MKTGYIVGGAVALYLLMQSDAQAQALASSARGALSSGGSAGGGTGASADVGALIKGAAALLKKLIDKIKGTAASVIHVPTALAQNMTLGEAPVLPAASDPWAGIRDLFTNMNLPVPQIIPPAPDVSGLQSNPYQPFDLYGVTHTISDVFGGDPPADPSAGQDNYIYDPYETGFESWN